MDEGLESRKLVLALVVDQRKVSDHMDALNGNRADNSLLLLLTDISSGEDRQSIAANDGSLDGFQVIAGPLFCHFNVSLGQLGLKNFPGLAGGFPHNKILAIQIFQFYLRAAGKRMVGRAN